MASKSIRNHAKKLMRSLVISAVDNLLDLPPDHPAYPQSLRLVSNLYLKGLDKYEGYLRTIK